ncbi:urease subunit beta [Halalkalibacter urbisdiaboli]|uniref:urease subunit beta n=1 Tax=Halalkalibacter urbisdiaboli TaxID=1960589 RepID=UPI000B439986|nr:urease subunit beta [Halalkalibacter urbisdiaboli]
MKPGEIKTPTGNIVINEGRRTRTLRVANTGDRPIQVGSHFHFAEVNRDLDFNRSDAYGMRLNIAAGTAVRFEPGEDKIVELVDVGGNKAIFGLNGLTEGELEQMRQVFLQRTSSRNFKGGEHKE